MDQDHQVTKRDLEWKPNHFISLEITGPLDGDKYAVLGHGISLDIAFKDNNTCTGVSFDMHEDTIVQASKAIASKGWTCVRFNFPYRQNNEKFDREKHVPEAEAAMLAVIKEYVAPKQKKLVIGGKSFGARIAVQIRSCIDRISGFCFLGYPVRPPSNHSMSHGMMEKALEQLMNDRMKHLVKLGRPSLFVEGTLDPFMPASALENIERDALPPAKVVRIEGGDHSFKLPKKEQHGDGKEKIEFEENVRQETLEAIGAAVADFFETL